MATVRIYDYKDNVLALDLRNLLDLFDSLSLQAIWTVSPVRLHYPEPNSFEEEFMATGQGSDQLEALARNGSLVSGTVLAEMANATGQIVWGEFAAVLPQQGVWVTIRAIDSTFYEVTTTDEAVLNKIRSTYKDVRAATGPANSVPIPQVARDQQHAP